MFVFLDIALFDQFGNEIIPFIGDDAFGIVVHLVFHSLHVFIDMILEFLRQFHFLQDFRIPLEQLDGVPAFLMGGQTALQGFFDMGQGMLHRTAEVMFRFGDGLMLGRPGGEISQFFDAGAGTGRNLKHRAAHGFSKRLRVDDVPVGTDHIHHVDGHDDRDPQFHQLGRQVQVPFQVGAVHDVQDRIGAFRDEIRTGNNFFQGVRGKGIDTRQILEQHVRMTDQGTFFLFDSNAGPVADELVGTRQGVEQCRFAGIRVPGKGNLKLHNKPSFQVV